jgi:acetyl esterase/lipase
MPQIVRYGEYENQVGDLHLPDAAGARPVVCLLHGGFWRLPYGREGLAKVAADLALRGYASWNIEYRRVGETGGGWPGTLDDVVTAIDHLASVRRNGADLDLGRVAIVGHSAGGQLALCAGARMNRASTRSAPSAIAPAAVCGLAAMVDLHEAFAIDAGNGAVRSFLGGSPQDQPVRYEEASPLRVLPLGVRQLLIHGTSDDAVPVELSRAYVQAARRAGDEIDYVELSGMGHMEYLDPSSNAHEVLCDWLGTALANDRRSDAANTT